MKHRFSERLGEVTKKETDDILDRAGSQKTDGIFIFIA
jgi:hypothetical protein